MVRDVLCYCGNAVGFSDHVTSCIEGLKNFIPMFNIEEDLFNEGTHVKVVAQESIELGIKMD
jgi:hypothetical protein